MCITVLENVTDNFEIWHLGEYSAIPEVSKKRPLLPSSKNEANYAVAYRGNREASAVLAVRVKKNLENI